MFNITGLLTVKLLKDIMANLPDDMVVCVAGTEDVIVSKEPESRANPRILHFDGGDVTGIPDEEIIFKTGRGE